MGSGGTIVAVHASVCASVPTGSNLLREVLSVVACREILVGRTGRCGHWDSSPDGRGGAEAKWQFATSNGHCPGTNDSCSTSHGSVSYSLIGTRALMTGPPGSYHAL